MLAKESLKRSTAKALRAGRQPHVTSILTPAAFRMKSSAASTYDETNTVQETEKSWVPSSQSELQRVSQIALLHSLNEKQQATASDIVPWFLQNMPGSYFRQTTEEMRLKHLKAICALQDASPQDLRSEQVPSTMQIKQQHTLANGSKVLSFIRTDNYNGVLQETLDQLPPDFGILSRVKVFTSVDNRICINTFISDPHESHRKSPTREDMQKVLDYASDVQNGLYAQDSSHPKPNPLFNEKELVEYMERCSPSFVRTSSTRRFLTNYLLYKEVSGSERVCVSREDYIPDGENNISSGSWISSAQTNVLPRVGLKKALKYLEHRNVGVIRTHMDRVEDPDNGNITLLRLLIDDQVKFSENEWETICHDMARLKWVDENTLQLALNKNHPVSLIHSEIIVALSSMLHGVLSKENMFAFSKSNIKDCLFEARNTQQAEKVAQLFMDRFNPENSLSDKEFQTRYTQLENHIQENVESSYASTILLKMLEVVKSTYRTNLYMPNRYGLALRVDPKIMMTREEIEVEGKAIPYGVFFVHGRRFNGFHVRFRDIARGGLRVVSPRTREQIGIESARQFDENYGLAFAQQLKNKDIPEGGSKAVVLVDTTMSPLPNVQNFIKRKAVKGFVDGILDLIVSTEETQKNIVNFWDKPEHLFLGPDEQIIPEDINWVIRNAKAREHPHPNTFMSSKPDAGINHKEFGVTSEGVAVFLDVALRKNGINPDKQEFTIKMTGGTDGDVCGNMIKILHRDYGKNAKIVGLADGTGCIEDPKGLNMDELLRLFYEEKPLSDFNAKLLSKEGKKYDVNSEDGLRARNTMHNRIRADVFVPAGGRPNTIDKSNYQQFLYKDKKTGKVLPSSPLIVEGANIFTTPEARQLLFEEAGVSIVKDSSANKCGVICSSYEIISAMLLSEEEFLSEKKEIVDDVLVKLRQFARMEAEMLFNEYKSYPGSLPYFSERISNCINRTRAMLLSQLDEMPDEELHKLNPLFKEHLPQRLAELAFDRTGDKVPLQYLKTAFAAVMGSRIVYQEGTAFVESIPADKLADVCFKYINGEEKIDHLLERINAGDLSKDDQELLGKLLKIGGKRSLLFADGDSK